MSKTAVNEGFRNGNKDGDHPDQAKLAGHEQSGQDDTDNKGDAFLGDVVDEAPGKARERALF